MDVTTVSGAAVVFGGLCCCRRSCSLMRRPRGCLCLWCSGLQLYTVSGDPALLSWSRRRHGCLVIDIFIISVVVVGMVVSMHALEGTVRLWTCPHSGLTSRFWRSFTSPCLLLPSSTLTSCSTWSFRCWRRRRGCFWLRCCCRHCVRRWHRSRIVHVITVSVAVRWKEWNVNGYCSQSEWHAWQSWKHATSITSLCSLLIISWQQCMAFNLLRQEGIKRCNFAQTGMPEPELHCERQLRGGSVANAKDLLVCDFFTASSSISTRETVSPRRTHCRVKQLCQSLSYWRPRVTWRL